MGSFIRNAGVAILSLLLVPATGLAQDTFFDSNGVRIRYVEQGSGDVIVLIHGNGGTLNFRSAHIVGYSMGASITAQLLTTHAERFMSATLGGAAGRFRWTDEQAASAEQEASERERECVSRSQIYRLVPTNGPKPDEEEIKKRSAACMANPNQDRFALAALARSRKDGVITPSQVSAVKVPTLGVVGSLDGYLTDFQELKKLRPDVKLVVIDGATHVGARGAMRRPEFIAAVREFIASNRTASSR